MSTIFKGGMVKEKFEENLFFKNCSKCDWEHIENYLK